MKEPDMMGCYVALGAAALGTLGLAVWMIGGETLRAVAVILAGAVALAASALPIRAYRRRDPTGETHYYHDGTTHTETRILDGRAVEAPRLYQLPAAPQGAAYPELLRAAWQAGMLASGSQAARADDPADQGQELRPLDGSEWGGDIAP